MLYNLSKILYISLAYTTSIYKTDKLISKTEITITTLK